MLIQRKLDFFNLRISRNKCQSLLLNLTNFFCLALKLKSPHSFGDSPLEKKNAHLWAKISPPFSLQIPTRFLGTKDWSKVLDAAKGAVNSGMGQITSQMTAAETDWQGRLFFCECYICLCTLVISMLLLFIVVIVVFLVNLQYSCHLLYFVCSFIIIIMN